MPLVHTAQLRPGELRPDTLQVYNGLDSMVTVEVFEEFLKAFPEVCTPGRNEASIYDFERSLQGPILEIMLRGFRVDQYERRKAMAEVEAKIVRLDKVLQDMAFAMWGRPLNPRSYTQLKDFFYKTLRLPEQWVSKKGERKLSFGREVLEKLEVHFYARPIVATIMAMRDNLKILEILSTEVDPDGRMRTSYNIAGTETGRLSSSANAFGSGGNLQNIPPDLRRVYIADDGWKLCVIDLEQAESREVGFILGVLFDDWAYLDACEGGDLHSANAKLIWPNLAWPNTPKGDRAIAEQNFYRDFSYRDMAKRGGHGIVYYGTPWTMSRHLKVPVGLMEDFQNKFFAALPGIPRWHQWTAQEIQTKQVLTTFFGFTRHFFGRPNDDTTLREAIAFQGQSPTATRTNEGMRRHWVDFGTETQLLGQTHDSITFQYRDDPAVESRVVPRAVKLMEIELRHRKRSFVIPGEAKVGWNWGNSHNPDKPTGPKNRFNPNGLVKYKGSDNRVRLTGMERPV